MWGQQSSAQRSSVDRGSGLYPVWMDAITSRPMQMRGPLGIVSFIVGTLAIALSVGGQLLAAKKHATDWNAGHPFADQPVVHALLVTPGLILSVLSFGIGCYVLWNYREHRGFALCGVALGAITVALTGVDFPGSMAFHYWYAPLWEDI